MSAPVTIFNPPGLPAIRYRCGTFTSFRRAMLDRVADPDLLASAVTFLARPAAIADNQIAVTDALNFPVSEPFRIRIRNEYLTVVSGAGTLTWRVARGSTPVSLQQGDPVVLDPENPFLRWQEGIDSDYQTMFAELWAYLGDILTFYQERIANEAFLGTATQRESLSQLAALIGYRTNPGAAATGIVAFVAGNGQTVNVPAGFRVASRPSAVQPGVTFETSVAVAATGDNSVLLFAADSLSVQYEPQTVVIQDVNTKLKQNDYLLAIEHVRGREERAHLLRIGSVTPDAAAGVTTIVWKDVLGEYTQASKRITLYSFGVVAAPLGHIAPRWIFLSPYLNNINGLNPGAFFDRNWDDERELWYYIPTPGDSSNILQLNATYDQLKYTPEHKGWAVLLTDGDVFQVMHVSDARPTGKTAYAMASQTTRLTFDETIPAFTFPLRATQILTGTVALGLQQRLPLPAVLSGDTLMLSGIQSQLQPGQKVLLQGALADTGMVTAEVAVLAGSGVTDPVDNTVTVQFQKPLVNQFSRSTCKLYANVVEVTQGETIKDEALGTGNASAFQSFTLAQHPVTFLPASDSEGLSAVQSSLEVRVNGVMWNERQTLAESTPDAQEYLTSTDDSGETAVMFGDGFNGARPPSGSSIHARYRKGLGASGDLDAGLIQLLADGLPNLQKVTNPLPSAGGTDPEDVIQIRKNAPSSLRTFGRAINAADYAALALTYPGIAQASAAWIPTDPATGVSLPNPYVQLTVAAADRRPLLGTPLFSKLRRFLDNHRDPNVSLRLQDFNPVYLQVAITLDIDGRFPSHATQQRVQAALNPQTNADGSAGYFSFAHQRFGRPIYQSEIYAAIQAIPGVEDSNITTLLRLGPSFPDDPSAPPHDIGIGPTEIATIDPSAFPGSSLTISGRGGFEDQ